MQNNFGLVFTLYASHSPWSIGEGREGRMSFPPEYGSVSPGLGWVGRRKPCWPACSQIEWEALAHSSHCIKQYSKVAMSFVYKNVRERERERERESTSHFERKNLHWK